MLDAPGLSGAPRRRPVRGLREPASRPEHAQALAASPAGDPVAEHWRAWLAVRDACPLGREHRYPEALIHYVYTKDRAVLRAARKR